MAYSYKYSRNYSNAGRKNRRNKYTKAETIAFRMGQEARIRKSVYDDKNKDSRVYASFCNGFKGSPANNKNKPLY